MTVWVVGVMLAAIMAIAGLAYDGGGAVTRQSEIIDVAWALARVASSHVEIDPTSHKLTIDEPRARDAVTDAALAWPDLTWELDVDGDAATIRVQGSYRTRLLTRVGVDEWKIDASRTALAVGSSP